MKILMLTSSFPRYPGDYQGNFIFHLARGQVDRGNSVLVVCPHVPKTQLHETMDGVEIIRFRYFLPERLESLSSHTGMYSALRHSLLAWFQLPLFFLCQWYASDRIIRNRNIDVIHAHWIVPQGLTGYLCTRLRKKPLVISSHVLDAQVFSRWPVFLPLFWKILSGCRCLTANSTFTRKVIGDLCRISCQCRVIPMGVVSGEPVLRNHDTDGKSRILFVGRLIEWKGVDVLIRAMAEVSSKNPDVVLSIIGEGPQRAHLENLARELGISGQVRFHGHITDSELISWYSRASVFVLPSRSRNGIVMEGLGVVLLEAMANGIPVIGSNIGGIPDIIRDGENGFLFPEGNDKFLAEKIIALLSDYTLADRFTQAGYETVRTQFSWDVLTKEFSDVYREAAERSRG